MPAVTTQVSPPTITLGGTFADTATLSGGAAPTGTVRFDVYGPNDATCAGPVALTSTNAIPAPGTTVTSDTFTPPLTGTYRVIARYSGDANNEPLATLCNDPAEVVTVAPAASPPPPPPVPPPVGNPTLTTVASPTIALGGQVTDTATVSGRVGPVPGATVRFELFAPGDIDCTGIPVFTATVPVTDAGTATSPPFTPAEAGTYRWRASYGGDASNAAVSGACNAPGESVAVTSATEPQVVSARFQAPPVLGRSAILAVRAVAPRDEISGLQVGFGEGRGLAGVSGCRVRALGLSRAVRILRLAYVFRRTGRHVVTIEVLAGDCTGALRRAVTTIGVDVLPAPATRNSPRRAPGTGVRTAAARAAACKDRFLEPTKRNLVRIASATLCLVNAERRRLGRKNLVRSFRLARASRAHSADMLRRKYFEHERVPGGPTLVARLRKAGYRGPTFAENIGYGSTNNPTLQVLSWMNSPGHRSNILHPRLKYAGVGVTIGIPVRPQLPGAMYTMDYGSTFR